jgi:PAS domain S-box-containing protein
MKRQSEDEPVSISFDADKAVAASARQRKPLAKKPQLIEDKLLVQEWQSSALLEALPAAIYKTDPEGRITFYNEAAAQLWGCRPELGTSTFCGSWKLYWPDGTPLPHDQCPMAIALKERRPIRGMEAVAERPDGTRVPFIPYPTPLYDSSGTFIGAVNMLADISERKSHEDNENLLASIVSNSDDAIVSKNLDGTITSWNIGAERLFGYLAAEIIGKPILVLIPAERQNEEPMILERIGRGERIDHYETVRRRKDGSLVDVSLSVSPVKSGNKVVGAAKIVRDISEKKRAEERMLLLAREVDHRANNLLAVVQAAIQLSTGDTVDSMKAAIMGRVRALGHAHSLLSASRWAGADLRRLIEEELAPYNENDGRIQIDGQSRALPPELAQSMALALHELATNAAKYGALSIPEGKIRIEWKPVGASRMLLRWSENGGPAVVPPTKSGFGTVAIERMFRGQLDGDIRFDWRPEGIVCEIIFAAN